MYDAVFRALLHFLFYPFIFIWTGELAQLARASALQAEGQGFKSPILQNAETDEVCFGIGFYESKAR